MSIFEKHIKGASQMTALNNISKIRELLDFEENTTDRIYFIQILLRKKDGNTTINRNNKDRCIKYYTVDSLEAYDKVAESVIRHCDFEGARAYIHLTPRSKQLTMLRMLQDIANCLAIKDYDKAKYIHASALGRYPAPDCKKTWIVDIDEKSDCVLDYFTRIINSVAPVNEPKILAVIPTKSGHHLITRPFDTASFNKLAASGSSFKSPDIHKDNPTVLYIPESIMGGDNVSNQPV